MKSQPISIRARASWLLPVPWPWPRRRCRCRRRCRRRWHFSQELVNKTRFFCLIVVVAVHINSSTRSSVIVVVIDLASRPPQFLGSASSAPEGLGSQIGANLVHKRLRGTLNKSTPPSSSVPGTTLCADQSNGTASLVQPEATKLRRFCKLNPARN